MSRCTLSALVSALLVATAGVVIVAGPHGAALAAGYTAPVLVDLDLDGGLLMFEPTASPAHAIVYAGAGASQYRWTFETDEIIPVGDDVTIAADGATGWKIVDAATFRRIDLRSGDIIGTYTVPFVTDWYVSAVGTPVGSLVPIQGDSASFAATRSFLFDLDAGVLVTPDPTGVGPGVNHRVLDVSDDARVVVYRVWAGVGDPGTVVEWNRTTGTRTVIGPWVERSTSPDGAWTAELVGGVLRRTAVRTGSIDAVPIDGATISSYAVFDGGRVVVRHRAATATYSDAEQLSVWDGVDTTLLSVGTDGEPADYGLDGYLGRGWIANHDASVVAFSSFATNLRPTVGAPTERRIFRVIGDHHRPDPWSEPARPAGKIAPSDEYCMPTRGTVPGDVVAVNVTPVRGEGAGFGTLHSSDEPAGSTSNVNFRGGSVDPNVAFVAVGPDGRICFTNSPDTVVDVIVDELVVADGSLFSLPTPNGAARIADTRDGLGGAAFSPSERRCFGSNGDPGDYVAVNITPVRAKGRGFGTVHSSDDDAGDSSNVNFGVGSVDPNLAIVQVGTDGEVCFTNSPDTTVDLVLDELVVADPASFGLPTPDGADRLADTRAGVGGGTIAPGETRCFPATNADPGGWVAVNATPVRARSRGYGTLHSSDDEPGTTSNVNFDVGTVDPNLAIVRVGSDRRICFTNSPDTAVDLILDQQINATPGTFSPPTANGAQRLTDTRSARH